CSPPPSLFFSCSRHHRALHSFPTRRSSDLGRVRSGTHARLRGARRRLHDRIAAATSRSSGRPVAASPHLQELRYPGRAAHVGVRSEEHTSELQSRENLVCRLLLEKKKKKKS